MHGTTKARVLLIEFITIDRFHRSIPFPFVKGALKLLGIPTHWIRFAMKASVRFEKGEAGIGLSPEDAESLKQVVGEFNPTHILFSNKPSETLLNKLKRARQGNFVFMVDSGWNISLRSLFEWLHLSVRQGGVDKKEPLERFLASENIFEAVTPDFGWSAGNELAEKADPLPFIVTGVDCIYARKFNRNPVFNGVPLDECTRPYGCSFCTKPADVKPWETAPIVLAERQLKALKETHPRFLRRPKIRITGDQIFFEIEKFSHLLREIDFPPADFLFDTRADHLVRFEQRLVAALKNIRATGHKIHICLIGIENFSKPELQRMNKGISPTINLKAVETLLRLEREHNETFDFREHGGLSMIMFTPWTTLEDLLLNLSIVREFDLQELSGKFFNSRLRLYEGLGLTSLARHHGLLIQRYYDRALDTAKRNFYPDEIPWKFLHPEVTQVNRILTRIDLDEGLKGDKLYKKVQESLLRTRSEPDRLGFAIAVIEAAVEKRGRKTTVPGVLQRAEDIFQRRMLLCSSPHNQQEEEPALVPGEVLSMLPQKLKAIKQLGVKPVFLFEPVKERDIGKVKGVIAAYFEEIVVKKRRSNASRSAHYQFFAGNDKKKVGEAAELIGMYDEGRLKSIDERAVLKRIGELLGYPECCVEAFADEAPDFRRMNERLHLARRVHFAVAVHPGFNPFIDLIWYVPCSLSCAKSIELIERLLCQYRCILSEQEYKSLVSRGVHPFLFLLDRPAQNLELIPLESSENSIKFKAGRLAGDDLRLKKVSLGDTAVVEEGRVTILKNGKIVESFCMNGYIWSCERAFFPEFWQVWQRLWSNRLRNGRRSAEGESAALSLAVGSEESQRLLGEISSLLEKRGIRNFHGFEVASLEASMKTHIYLTLKKGGEIIKLLIEERHLSERSFIATEKYALSYKKETPVDTEEKAAAVRALAEILG